jgi:mannan endo-1,4-beta-mannosidase
VKNAIILAIFCCVNALYAFNANLTVNTANERKLISPYIYGTNQLLTGQESWSLARLGGNRWTGYNWENNASNAGSDWSQHSDNFLGGGETPGKAVTDPVDANHTAGRYSLITLPMAGFVAKDKNGTVSEAETAPSSRWVKIEHVKSAAFASTPDLNDNAVYNDEFVNFLVKKYGKASAGSGVEGYLLDNEPALWPSTHPRIHPQQPTCQELLQRSVPLAKAIKGVDETAQVWGPVLYGFAAMTDFQGAPDWATVSAGKGYDWFVDYYLDRMKQSSDSAGKRLLDVFDFHWYSEAKGDNRIVDTVAITDKDQKARVQAPRTLWQDGYVEDSWIGQWGTEHLPLLPKIQAAIGKWNPGTKLSITEWNYGGESDITGGVAFADALGIYGKMGVYAACYWQYWRLTDYTTAAFKLYRNYDGQNGKYGDVYVQSATSDWQNSSIYAAEQSGDRTKLHLIVINKSFTEAMNATITLTSDVTYKSGVAWGYDSKSAAITEKQAIPVITNNSFTCSVPALSVYHLVLSGEGGAEVRDFSSVVHGDGGVKVSGLRNRIDVAFELSDSRHVTIGLYDLFGKEITMLHDGLATGGTYSQHYAVDLPTGMYVIKVKVGRYAYCKKIQLM